MADRNALATLQALARALPGIAQAAMEETMRQAQDVGKRTTAFHNRTGRLRASIRAGVEVATTDRVVGVLTAGADDAQPGRGDDWVAASREYAPALELGTGRSSPRPFIAPTMRQVLADGVLHRALAQHWGSFRP